MLASSLTLIRFADPLKRSKFIPDEFVHGVFAPNSRLREQVTPAQRGKRCEAPTTPAERHRAMSWAQRLKRVFQIEIERGVHCDGRLRIICLHRSARGDRTDSGVPGVRRLHPVIDSGIAVRRGAVPGAFIRYWGMHF